MQQENQLKHHPAILTKENTALVVVDVQEKLLPYVTGKDEVVSNIQLLIKFVHIMDIPVILRSITQKALELQCLRSKKFSKNTNQKRR